MSRRSCDVAIIGGGLIGRSAALTCLRRGLNVTLFDTRKAGEASPAGAGLLAPAMEGDGSDAEKLLIAGRDLWPSYLASLAAMSPVPVALSRDGIVALAHDGEHADRQRAAPAPRPHWRDDAALRRIEPGLEAPLGGVLHELDGAVDNVALLSALADALSREPGLTRLGPARGIVRDGAAVRIEGRDGATVLAAAAVIAAGAWASRVQGLPRLLPVEPVRGEMIGFPVTATRHAIYGPGAYVVPRPGGRTIVGATMDQVGFDSSTTTAARRRLHEAVSLFLPGLASLEPDSQWAGLRPVSPDGLPVLGREPSWPALIYATGHGRNGILLTPLTAESIAAWACNEAPQFDLSPFRPERFE